MTRKPIHCDSSIGKNTNDSTKWLNRTLTTNSSSLTVSWADASWVIQRGTAILIVPCVLFGNISILTILFILASFHFYIGITEILTDYIHNEVTRTLLNVLFSVLILFVLKESFLLLVFFFI